MKSLINDIEIGGVKDALNILAKAGNEDLFEKAKHQIGDSHPKWPQLKWTDLGGGKFGWRTGTGRGKRASTSSNAGQASAGNSGGQASTGSNAGQAPQAKPAKTDATEKKVGDVSKLTAQQKSMVDKVMDKGFLIVSSKYNDKSKVELKKTLMGNWRCYYDGIDVGIINRKLISDTAAKKIGWYKDAPQAKPAKTDTTEKKKEKKLRPVGTGTNGPERRKMKMVQKTDDISSTKINLSVNDYTKYELDDGELGYFNNAPLKLHDYIADVVEYYDNDGNKKKAGLSINEYYADRRQNKVGGYEARFDGDIIGNFKTLKEAVAALNDWANKMRVPGHGKPKWIYNANRGDYQMHYSLDVPASKANNKG